MLTGKAGEEVEGGLDEGYDFKRKRDYAISEESNGAVDETGWCDGPETPDRGTDENIVAKGIGKHYCTSRYL